MFKPNAETRNWEAPPELAPWRDLTDEEFAAIDAEISGLEKWFDRVPDEKTKTKGGDR